MLDIRQMRKQARAVEARKNAERAAEYAGLADNVYAQVRTQLKTQLDSITAQGIDNGELVTKLPAGSRICEDVVSELVVQRVLNDPKFNGMYFAAGGWGPAHVDFRWSISGRYHISRRREVLSEYLQELRDRAEAVRKQQDDADRAHADEVIPHIAQVLQQQLVVEIPKAAAAGRTYGSISYNAKRLETFGVYHSHRSLRERIEIAVRTDPQFAEVKLRFQGLEDAGMLVNMRFDFGEY
jgi:hypothetical protein